MYESDLTQFMRRYLEEHPEELESQKRGRAAWWDNNAETRSAPPPAQRTPSAGGAEHTFRALDDKNDEAR
jgi:hypothetical protein